MTLPRRLARATCCLVLLVWPAFAHAQPRRPLQIKDVRIGLPGGKDGQRCRVGAWSPVYVELLAGRDDLGAGDFELVTETSDSDDVQGQYVIPVPALGKGSALTVLTYFRPGNRSARLTVRVRRKGGAVVHSADKEPDPQEVIGPDEVLYLTMGARLPGLRRALLPPRKAEGEPEQETDVERAEHNIAHVERPDQLPGDWFGYAGVDVVVLSTGSADFLNGLLDASRSGSAGAAQALGEWLRRGGRLVIGVGRNYQTAKLLLDRLGIRGFDFSPPERAEQLPEVDQWAEHTKTPLTGLDVVRVRTGPETLTLAGERKNGKVWPVLALAPCGLGRVLLVAFDLDAGGFTTWKGQEAFWKRVHEELGPRPIARGKDQDVGDRPDELASSLQRGLENFEEIPVISFGWVAFFILLYILIIGPLDYFFLKKVVKRLELTWVTFPVVVLVVSVAAYFTAYALKGNDRRINKIDVVDIDLNGGEVQGTTWLALFSPRLESYTVGIEAGPRWRPGKSDGTSTVVTTLSPPDSSAGGVDRPGSQSLFRRPYLYAPRAAGLKGVPVPVWASRSFTASWRAKGDLRKLIEVKEFGLSRDGQRLTGLIHNGLPLELRDVTLLYAGRAHPLDNIPAGGFYRIDARALSRAIGTKAPQWLEAPFRPLARGEALASRGDREEKGTLPVPPPAELMKAILFHAQEGGPYSHLNNSNLRRLDQGWRLRGFKTASRAAEPQYLDEAILVGRAAVPSGPAEEVTQDGASATQLWLGKLPGDGEREPLKGYLSQETYVRIYIPVPRNP